MNRNTLIILIAAACIAAFMAVGNSDYKDELREFDHYCNMVEAGHWPDFKGIADECPKGEELYHTDALINAEERT